MKSNGKSRLVLCKLLSITGNKTQGYYSSTVIAFLLASGIFFLSGCIELFSHNLRITVQSFPSDANVYGVQGPLPGKFLGKTPLVLSYIERDGNIIGPLPEQTIEYTDKCLYFKCYIKKQGYGTYRIYECIEGADSGGGGRGGGRRSIKPTFVGGRKTYTVGLYKLPSDKKIQ